MTWCGTTRYMGAMLALTAGVTALARPAAAQDYERVLAGIRLNSTSKTVLARYGNPNEVVIGDVGIRGAGPNGGTGAGGPGGAPADGPGGGFPGAPGGFPGGGGLPGIPGGPGGAPGRFGGAGVGGGGGAAASGGEDGPGGGGGGFPGAPGGFGGGGAPGFPGAPGGGPGGGTSVGGFGQTVSTLARQQEVTWIYNRKINNNLISYEFLIGPNGNVSQIRVSGYNGGNAKTKRGINLGSTYKDVVRVYGYPEEHAIVGRVLVASYRKAAHIQFQFLNERGQANPMASGNKVVAVTIATVE